MAGVSGWMWEPQVGGCGDVDADVDVCARVPARNVMEIEMGGDQIIVKYWLAFSPKASSFSCRNSRCSAVVEHFAALQVAGSAGLRVSDPRPCKQRLRLYQRHAAILAFALLTSSC
jgi:hypothetical protein